MKIRIQVIIEDDDPSIPLEVEEIACLSRDTEQLPIETLGLQLAEAKTVLAIMQITIITHQTAQFMEHHRCCHHCGTVYFKNGRHHLTIRTLFGTVKIASQRFYTCSCQQREKSHQTRTRGSFSPLAQHLRERTTPEFRYLQARWSSLMSYGLTSSLLSEVLPLSKRMSTATLSRCIQRVAKRADSELGEEQFAFNETTSRLPLPVLESIPTSDLAIWRCAFPEIRKA